MVMTEFTYVFAIGTFFALLEAYNNGASTLNPSGTTHIGIFANQFSQTMSPTRGLRLCPLAPSHTSKPWSSV
jgi:hypothetical protein